MIEKLIENWLTNTNERGYMPAFCQMLVSQGYQLLYIAPHGPDEAGKDVIAKNSKGKVECFQLKHGDINLSEFRKIEGELNELLKHPIIHPSVSKKTRFKSTLVVNGRVKDPVRSRISQRNDVNWNETRSTKLDFTQREQLVQQFVSSYGSFFPQDAKNFKDFLEFYIQDGRDFLDKDKLCAFLESHFFNITTKTSKNKIAHYISSSLILVNYALAPWIKSKNHVVQIEAWTCLLSHIYFLVEKYNLPIKHWSQSEKIITTFIESSFEYLMKDVSKRSHLIEGDWPSDGLVYPARVTIILGYLTTYALYSRLKGQELDSEIESKILHIIQKHEDKTKFWGEAFVPHLMTYFWFNMFYGRQKEAIGRLFAVLRGLTNPKIAPQPYGFPNPYYSYEDSIRIVHQLTTKDERQHFSGESYTLWSILEIFARRNLRVFIDKLWPMISRTQYLELVPSTLSDFFLWRIKKGKLVAEFPKQTQSWSELVSKANTDDFSRIPNILIERPAFTVLFMLVFPHRITPQLVKSIDKKLFFT